MSPAFKHQQRNLEMNFSAYFAVNTADSEIANRWGGGVPTQTWKVYHWAMRKI